VAVDFQTGERRGATAGLGTGVVSAVGLAPVWCCPVDGGYLLLLSSEGQWLVSWVGVALCTIQYRGGVGSRIRSIFVHTSTPDIHAE
jgi:hypothetical protein